MTCRQKMDLEKMRRINTRRLTTPRTSWAEGLDGLTSFVAALFSQKVGRMEVAEQGTLFSGEVGDIPIEIQPKLARALQERNLNGWAVFPPYDSRARSVDIVRHP